ncbi:Phosphatidylinositol 3,4,5-trisphosphate 5-phosphatase 1 [Desmophyllum pertusum]|uniref:Phosphatidylinositol 3,4,5-trisphosphate 5-phosphatase 1 n=1 Tax=Desmophyllum pertusum TaxID=174260 RepID=A0A9X0D1G8_9CNID|nr:Phosphatidylinositol 3,4,5-trisphosphate 5-phosphatase 1 [Desmophyllum pertusum]
MSFPWHLPSINRLRAEELLLNTGINGSFIIRDSESVSNAHVLCLLHEGRIHHYRILRNENNGNFYMQAVPGVSANAFSKLEHLVTYYSQGHQGLPCELRQPAMLEDKDVADDDTDDDDDDLDEPDGKQIENEYEFPSRFMTNVEQLEPERLLDKGFHSAFGLYLGDGIKRDMEAAVKGETVLKEMQMLLATTSTSLIGELQVFLSRVNMLQNVFSLGDQHKLKCSLPEHSTEEPLSFKLLMDLLAESIAGAKSLQTQASNALKDVASINEEEEKQEPESRTRTFEVMIQGIATSSFKNKLYISVNYIEGKISFLKNQSEAVDANNTSDQSKVVQLVKSKDNIKRLRLKMESKPAKDFEFDDGKVKQITQINSIKTCTLQYLMKSKLRVSHGQKKDSKTA